jgi:hypothetical protein
MTPPNKRGDLTGAARRLFWDPSTPARLEELRTAGKIVDLIDVRTPSGKRSQTSEETSAGLEHKIRTNDVHVWFVAEHLVSGPQVHADGQTAKP